jgi:hypothetical protein
MTLATFALIREPAPPGLEELGDSIELHELPYIEARLAMGRSRPGLSPGEALVGETLVVDGEVLGADRLAALPGRFAGGILAALQRCTELYRLNAPPRVNGQPNGAAPEDVVEDDSPGEA